MSNSLVNPPETVATLQNEQGCEDAPKQGSRMYSKRTKKKHIYRKNYSAGEVCPREAEFQQALTPLRHSQFKKLSNNHVYPACLATSPSELILATTAQDSQVIENQHSHTHIKNQ